MPELKRGLDSATKQKTEDGAPARCKAQNRLRMDSLGVLAKAKPPAIRALAVSNGTMTKEIKVSAKPHGS